MSEDNNNTQPSAASEEVSSMPPNDNNHRDDDAYSLKVKSEYLLSERPSCLASIIPLDNNTDTNNNNNGNDDTNNKSSKNNNKGQNKKRPRDKQIASSDKVCLSIVRGEPCPFQNSPKGCKYNHDLKEMLVNRPLDICDGTDGATWLKEEGCPFWRLRG